MKGRFSHAHEQSVDRAVIELKLWVHRLSRAWSKPDPSDRVIHAMAQEVRRHVDRVIAETALDTAETAADDPLVEQHH